MNIPENARPTRDDLPAFSAIFSTYLTNSFDLINDPGKQLYSPRAHCFCPLCSWFVNAPRLKAKKIPNSAKLLAQRMRVGGLQNLAAKHRLSVGDDVIAAILDDRKLFEDASMLTYAVDLTKRQKGIANGPAVLVLWRGFAWSENGSPKPRFQLKAGLMIEAENRLLEVMRNGVGNEPSG